MTGPTGFFVEFLVAGAVGGLIGIEREHRDDGSPVVAGVRTFPLIAIAGFLAAVLAEESASPFVLAAAVLGIFGVAIMLMQVRSSIGQQGLTTPTAMIVTFLLGIAIGYEFVFEAVVIGIASTFLLVTKKRLHRFAQILDDAEILSALQFVTIVFILLPLAAALPEEAFGLPWFGRGNLIDPYVILLVVVFVSAMSFASLLAMRQVGPQRGVEFSGLMGGLVNSEATTAGLAHRAKEHRALVAAAVVGSLLASTTMLARNLAIAAFADRSFQLAIALAPYFVLVAIVGLVLAFRAREKHEPSEALRVKNPFAVLPALRFAAFFALVSVLVKLATTYFGDVGVYFAALGGFVSAGAVVASLGSLVATGDVTLPLAVRTALLATAASIGGKLIILRAVDTATFRRALPLYTTMTGVALVVAAASFLLS